MDLERLTAWDPGMGQLDKHFENYICYGNGLWQNVLEKSHLLPHLCHQNLGGRKPWGVGGKY